MKHWKKDHRKPTSFPHPQAAEERPRNEVASKRITWSSGTAFDWLFSVCSSFFSNHDQLPREYELSLHSLAVTEWSLKTTDFGNETALEYFLDIYYSNLEKLRARSAVQFIFLNVTVFLLLFSLDQKFQCPVGQTCKVQYVPCVMPKCKDAIAVNRPTCIKDPSGE